MLVAEITLTNFRSYEKSTIPLSEKTTLVIGPNASGKTNIIEGLCLSATGRSFRADQDAEMVRWGKEVGRIKTVTGETKLELVITTGSVQGKKVPTKKFLVNGIPRRSTDFAGILKAVLFWPEDLDLVTDSPSVRRKYLDRVLIQADREYRRTLSSYERGLRQRNKLLDLIAEGKAARSQLLFWDQLLIRDGGYVTQAREDFISYVTGYSVPGLSYSMIYDKSVISEPRLRQYEREEIAAKATLVGPHRDDFQFLISTGSGNQPEAGQDHVPGFRNLTAFGSRGEQRLGVLWLKLAELSYLEARSQDRPLLLLDDIFSELDEENRKRVLSLIRSYQAVITTSEENVEDILHKAQIPYRTVRLGQI